MLIRQLNVHRVAIALAFGTALTSALAGERVIFSKPDAPVASPVEKRPEAVPERAADIRDLNHQQPQVAMPFLPQPAFRPEPRRAEPKKSERRTIFDEPALFSDPNAKASDTDEKQREHNAIAASADRNAPPRTFVLPGDPFRVSEPEKALSPIRQYDWTPDTEANKRSDKGGDRNASLVSRWENDNERVTSSIFSKPREDEEKGLVGSIFGALTASQKRELTPDQLQRRADFEKLVNPSFSPLGPRDPAAAASSIGSPFEMTKPPQAPALIQVQGPSIAEQRSLDPMHALNEQQRGLRGPTFDDLNKKAFNIPGQPSVTPPVSTTPDRRPLMAQPTFQDFPSRRF